MIAKSTSECRSLVDLLRTSRHVSYVALFHPVVHDHSLHTGMTAHHIDPGEPS
jgi:hypothetical protein